MKTAGSLMYIHSVLSQFFLTYSLRFVSLSLRHYCSKAQQLGAYMIVVVPRCMERLLYFNTDNRPKLSHHRPF